MFVFTRRERQSDFLRVHREKSAPCRRACDAAQLLGCLLHVHNRFGFSVVIYCKLTEDDGGVHGVHHRKDDERDAVYM